MSRRNGLFSPCLGMAEIERTIQFPIDFPHPQAAAPEPLLCSSLLDCLHAIHNARCLRAVLLQHLAQLLDHAPQVIHVRLLAAAGQAVNHGDTVLLAAGARAADGTAATYEAVSLNGGLLGGGRGRGAGHGLGRRGGVKEGEVVHGRCGRHGAGGS